MHPGVKLMLLFAGFVTMVAVVLIWTGAGR